MSNSRSSLSVDECPAPGDALTDMLGFQLFRLSSSIGTLGERAAQELAGLTLPEYRCLAVLTTQGPLGVVALCQVMSIDRAWVSRTLGKLAGKELVKMSGDPKDGRKVFAEPTTKGRRIAQKLIERSTERQAHLFEGLTDTEVTALRKMLYRIQRNADSLILLTDKL
jgi:DNA-binding MarR family transcriptional regulator